MEALELDTIGLHDAAVFEDGSPYELSRMKVPA
jgi:hypothetical protein